MKISVSQNSLKSREILFFEIKTHKKDKLAAGGEIYTTVACF
jgi:hypothetical protein